MADEEADNIAARAAEPKRARGDSVEVEAHSITDQIKADEYKRKVAAGKGGIKGFRLGKFTFPGSV